MKEYPILFKGELVRAILEGRKTQTRRMPDCRNAKWQIGDRLYVKETYSIIRTQIENRYCKRLEEYLRIGKSVYAKGDYVVYKADGHLNITCDDENNFRADGWERSYWESSLFMPRKISRILLEITGIREEYLQDITIEDIIKEGLRTQLRGHDACCDLKSQWIKLWDTCAPDGFKWVDNPKIKVTTFKRSNNESEGK